VDYSRYPSALPSSVASHPDRQHKHKHRQWHQLLVQRLLLQPPPLQQKMSSQMQAVVRLMTGQAERTIQENSLEPTTWEQYKKDNHDKLNLEGVDQKEMEE
jgi:hypothetical protein